MSVGNLVGLVAVLAVSAAVVVGSGPAPCLSWANETTTMAAAAETRFEPADFSVDQALRNHGVDISLLPALYRRASYQSSPGSESRSRSGSRSGSGSGSSFGSGSSLSCSVACDALRILYGTGPGGTVLDARTDRRAYSRFAAQYWSRRQADVTPRCVFRPARAAQVSVLVLLSRLTECPFAVRSGGHAGFHGASNIRAGITVSLERLDHVVVAPDRRTVSVGSGNRWGRVYDLLIPHHLTVVGGRVTDIGVGGLTTGGGLSFFSGLHGWACDNVASYDVVTAMGAMVTASPTSHPDLYWALRGGGNNFGIVTSFNYEAIPLPDGRLWGGSRLYPEDKLADVVDAFATMVDRSDEDTKAGQWIALFGGGSSSGGSSGDGSGGGGGGGTTTTTAAAAAAARGASVELWHADPDGGSTSPLFAAYDNITGATADTMAAKTITQLAAETQEANPYGFRQAYYSLTVGAERSVAQLARDIFYDELARLAGPSGEEGEEEEERNNKIGGLSAALIYQAITAGQLRNMARKGGNALGLDRSGTRPLYLLNLACGWTDAADDGRVLGAMSRTLARIAAAARRRGAHSDFVYMNYASEFQDVVASYGPASKARLGRVAARYDPAGVFQRLQPGYFKLDRAPRPRPGRFSF